MKKQKNRFGMIFLAVFLLFAVLTGGVFLLRFRNSVRIRPSQDIQGAQAVLYRQDDKRWAAEKLGNSDYTMKSSGCLVSCIASGLTMDLCSPLCLLKCELFESAIPEYFSKFW